MEGEKSYHHWRNEISACQLVTETKPHEQVLVVKFCLPRKARETALETDAKDLDKDDGVTMLLTNLDSLF